MSTDLELIVGLAVMYALVHSVVVIVKKTTNLTSYEKVLLSVSLCWVVLLVFSL